MNKVYGLTKEFAPIRNDRSRLIVAYGIEATDNENYSTWYEIYFYKKPHPYVSNEEIKEAILADINAQTDEKILKDFVWENNKVWLSTENQFNFKAAYDIAVQTEGANLPIKFKLGEQEDGTPIYHTFDTFVELQDFYTKAINHINNCLNEGWQRKDAINWENYKLNK